MAILQHIDSKEMVILSSQHTVGRSKSNLICVQERDISKTHATFFWENGKWYLRDHSRNGTKVDNHMVHQSTTQLNEEATIQFGTNTKTSWKLINNRPPTSYLQAIHNTSLILELASTPLYPDEQEPIVSFYFSKAMQWAADNGDTTEELVHNQHYFFDDKEWVFMENEPLEDTVDNMGIIKKACIDCHLSPDEEGVEVKLVINDLELNLGEHVYNHLLLLLVRKRLDDIRNNFSFEEQGWVFTEDVLTQLSKELVKEIDVYYFNIMIHRLRKHLKSLKPYGHLFSNIIERKRGKIRLNHAQIRILKGKEVIDSHQ